MQRPYDTWMSLVRVTLQEWAKRRNLSIDNFTQLLRGLTRSSAREAYAQLYPTVCLLEGINEITLRADVEQTGA